MSRPAWILERRSSPRKVSLQIVDRYQRFSFSRFVSVQPNDRFFHPDLTS
jgi:hypothetical protein